MIPRIVSACMMVGVLVVVPGPAGATVFSNTALIKVPGDFTTSGGVANPYPSTISVPASGAILDVNVTLNDVNENNEFQLDVLLVGPSGQSVELMANAGCDTQITHVNLTFDDAAATSLTTTCAKILSGTYKPYGPDLFSGIAPAPSPPYGHTLSVLNGTDPNGTWKLFAFNRDFMIGGGSIAGGWSLDITTLTISAVVPQIGEAGDTVTITGTAFTGATVVKFGSSQAVFTVDSDTQITAKVPIAGSGPISVTVPGGSVTSSVDFVVNHARDVSIRLSGKIAKGTVHAVDGFPACASTIPVRVQHLIHGRWHAVASVLTRANGSYTAGGLVDPGKYRAVAKKETLNSGDVCLKSTSPTTNK